MSSSGSCNLTSRRAIPTLIEQLEAIERTAQPPTSASFTASETQAMALASAYFHWFPFTFGTLSPKGCEERRLLRLANGCSGLSRN
jgi:hypothetical protein